MSNAEPGAYAAEWTPPVTRLYCPIGTCEWTWDDPGPSGTVASDQDIHDLLMAHAVATESVVREHLETHSLLEWVQEVMRLRGEQGARSMPATEYGGVSIRTDQMPEGFPVTGKDGTGHPTPTVRELAAILRALPEEFQDMPVTRYCEEGVWGIRDEASYEHESRRDECTPHIAMW